MSLKEGGSPERMPWKEKAGYVALAFLAFTLLTSVLALPSQSRTAKDVAFEELLGGQAPRSLWRLNPGSAFLAKRLRSQLLDVGPGILAPGRRLQEARDLCRQLAWVNAMLPSDAKVAALLLWSSYYIQKDLSPEKRKAVCTAQREIALRAGYEPDGDLGLAYAGLSVGLMGPIDAVKFVASTRRSADRREKVERKFQEALLLRQHLAWPVKAVLWVADKVVGLVRRHDLENVVGLSSVEAFCRFNLRPTQLAHPLPVLMRAKAPPEAQRLKFAQLALAKGWGGDPADSLTRSAEVLADAGKKDEWLDAVYASLSRTGGAASLNGQELDKIELAFAEWLQRSAAPSWPIPLAESEKGYSVASFEGTRQEYGVKRVHWPRVEYQARLRKWAATAKILPPPPAIEPLLSSDGRLSDLGVALSLLAADQLVELPQPVFAYRWHGIAYSELGFMSPHAGWGPDDGAQLERRLYCHGRLQGMLHETKGNYSISVRLASNGKAGPWSTRSFTLASLGEAPGWIATQAYRSAKGGPSPANARALKAIGFKRGEQVRSFANALAERDLKFDTAKRWRLLYAACPTATVLAHAKFGVADDGTPIEDLLERAISKEPWRASLRLALADRLSKTSRWNESVEQYLTVLQTDPSDIVALESLTELLNLLGLVGEDIQTCMVAMSLTAQAPRQVAAVHNQYLDWAWLYRTAEFSNDVQPWGFDCVEAAALITTSFTAQAMQKWPDDARLPVLRIMEGRISKEHPPKDEMDAWFEKARALDPKRETIYLARMDDLMPKWHGSEQEMLAFARNWERACGGLVAGAHDQIYFLNTDHYRDAEVWAELRKTYMDEIGAEPWRMDLWQGYFLRAARGGRLGVELTALDLTLKDLPASRPYHDQIVIAALDGADKFDSNSREPISNDHKALEDPGYWKLYADTYRRLIGANPDNEELPAALAKKAFKYRHREAAVWALSRLKGVWVESQWTRKEFDAANKWAFGPNKEADL